MKKQLCRVGIAILLITTMLLSGCGGGFFEEETLEIASIDYEEEEDGSFWMIINFKDEYIEPSRHLVRKGNDGTEGTGIKNITYKNNPETNETIATITLSDGTVKEVAIANGVSVTGIDTGMVDGTNTPYIIFKYSNGDQSEAFYLPQGEKGNGIKSYSATPQEDKSVLITFEFDDGTKLDVVIPAPQEGNGIQSMSASESGEYYTITVNYTNRESQTLDFKRPADPNSWTADARIPEPSEGRVGDYFFDTAHAVIYVKSATGWDDIVYLKAQEVEHTVKFDLNDAGDASMSGYKVSYKVKYNTYFASNGYGDIPVPTREGYTFAGWYTKIYESREDIPVTASPFTDLTPILSDLTLYAVWEKNP